MWVSVKPCCCGIFCSRFHPILSPLKIILEMVFWTNLMLDLICTWLEKTRRFCGQVNKKISSCFWTASTCVQRSSLGWCSRLTYMETVDWIHVASWWASRQGWTYLPRRSLVFQAGYHPCKRTFKTHPKHIFFWYENRPLTLTLLHITKPHKNYLQNTQHVVLRNHPTLSIHDFRITG